ncbi:hypothetical protein BsWGS_16509 [Bradybaena similaris]
MNKLRVFLGFHELATIHYYKALMCEFLGTCILIVSGCGSCVAMDEGRPLSTLTTALTFGMTVAYIVWTFNHVSGAHINPVVTFAFMITGIVSLTKTIGYIIAQCVGAIAGAAIVWYMVPPSWRGNIGSTVFHQDITLAQGFFVEAISTFIMVLGVFATSDRYRTDHSGSLPLTIGLIVFIESAWAGKLTGNGINPARTLGPALVSGAWDHHWVYWLAPTLGATVGALLYQHVLAESPQQANTSIHIEPAILSQEDAPYLQKFTDQTIIVTADPKKL